MRVPGLEPVRPGEVLLGGEPDAARVRRAVVVDHDHAAGHEPLAEVAQAVENRLVEIDVDVDEADSDMWA